MPFDPSIVLDRLEDPMDDELVLTMEDEDTNEFPSLITNSPPHGVSKTYKTTRKLEGEIAELDP